MTPTRLRECLDVVRWPAGTLAAVLAVDNVIVDRWLDGSLPIPMRVASWLEALSFTHEASDRMRPVVDQGEGAGAGRRPEKLEHVPVYSYNLLRTLERGPVELRKLFGTDDEGAVFFLVSRGLAERDGEHLTITDEGRKVGELSAPATSPVRLRPE